MRSCETSRLLTQNLSATQSVLPLTATNARIEPASVPLAQGGQKDARHAGNGTLTEVGEHAVEFLMEQCVEKHFAVAGVHVAIDADDATLVVDVAEIPHAIVNDPAPTPSPTIDEGRSNAA